MLAGPDGPPASHRRVVVTGMGVCTPLGIGCATFWAACLRGRQASALIPERWRRYAGYRSSRWAPLPTYDPAEYGLRRGITMRLDPSTQLCLIAAQEAVAQAGLVTSSGADDFTMRLAKVTPERAGVFIGNGAGGIASMLNGHLSHLWERRKAGILHLCRQGVAVGAGGDAGDPGGGELQGVAQELTEEMGGITRLNPVIVAMQMPNATAAQLQIRYGLKGSGSTVCLACASGTIAIGHAHRAIADGRLDLALAGGTEFLGDAHGSIFHGFDCAGTLTRDQDPSAPGGGPFDRARSGFLFSEGGSGVLVIEELQHALERGANPIAEIIGFGEANEAHSIMAPEPDGATARRLLAATMADAGLTTDDIDYINAHGTGTVANDSIEASILADAFGRGPVVNSTKSLIGHTIGACGAIEAAVTCMSIASGQVHANARLANPIAELDFPTATRQRTIRHALSLSFAFGGHAGVLAFSDYRR